MNCRSCHQENTTLLGPALNAIFKKKDSVWITKFIADGETVKKEGDKRAVRNSKEYAGSPHVRFNNFDKAQMDEIMEYLKVISEAKFGRKWLKGEVIFDN